MQRSGRFEMPVVSPSELPRRELRRMIQMEADIQGVGDLFEDFHAPAMDGRLDTITEELDQMKKPAEHAVQRLSRKTSQRLNASLASDRASVSRGASSRAINQPHSSRNSAAACWHTSTALMPVDTSLLRDQESQKDTLHVHQSRGTWSFTWTLPDMEDSDYLNVTGLGSRFDIINEAVMPVRNEFEEKK